MFDQYKRRVLMLLTASTYRAHPFFNAAEELGIEVLKAVDLPRELAEFWHERLGLDFADLAGSTAAIVALYAEQPFDAILPIDDSGSLLAAAACAALGLRHNNPQAAAAARDKFLMRQALAAAGVRVPAFRLCHTSEDPRPLAQAVGYPCVIKPLELNGSRGVIRADTEQELLAAVARLSRMLEKLYPQLEQRRFLIEGFIPGFEVALEGLLDRGRLHTLALFDKPDPLDGPFFEETIYVTPSRLAPAVQQAIFDCAAESAAALGLRDGPLHAEFRINQQGPWILELAGRSIGGLCSQTLRFGVDVSLEQLILRQAVGLPLSGLEREPQARGVMMIPIPAAGILRNICGLEAARQVPGIEDIQITAQLHYPIQPLPEGDSYLGFIFARAETPAAAEAALRQAHALLSFSILPQIELQTAIPA